MTALINPWKETDSGVWERGTHGYERFFLRLATVGRQAFGGREDYFILSQIRISPTPSKEQVFAAWLSIRSLQPALATDWRQDGNDFKKTYHVGNEDQLAQDTLAIIKGSFASAYPSLGSQSIPKLLFFPDTGELVLRTPHWAMDARGTLFFWDIFLAQLSSPVLPDGKETSRLPPSISDSLGCIPPGEVTEEQSKGVTDHFMEWAAGGDHVVHPPTTADTDDPGAPTFQDAQLDEQQTRQLIQACKQRGFSVTSAVHAAVVLTNIAQSENKDGGAKSHGIAVWDFRKYTLAGEANKYPVNLYAVPSTFSLPLPTTTTDANFADVAQWFGRYYKEAYQSSEDRRLIDHYFNLLDAAISSPQAASAPPQKDPHTSAIGIIDDYIKPKYGEWSVDDFHFVCEATMKSSCIFWYTFRGKLRLVYAYNEALYKQKVIRAFLDSMTGLLVEGMYSDTS